MRVRNVLLTFIERVIMKGCWVWSHVSLPTIGCEIPDRVLASGPLVHRAWGCCKGYLLVRAGWETHASWLWRHLKEKAVELPFREDVGLAGRCFTQREQCEHET